MKGLRRKLLASITTLVVAIVSVAGSAYAWFTLSTTVDAKMEFEVVAGDGLEISYVIKNTSDGTLGAQSAWSSTVSLPMVENFGAVTSMDGKTFGGIKIDPNNSQGYVMDGDYNDDTKAFTTQVAGGWYEVVFHFRTQTDGILELDSGTAVTGEAGTTAKDAVRVSFTNNAGTPATTIWEPNTTTNGGYGAATPALAYANNAGWKHFVQHAVGDSAGAYNPETGALQTGVGEDNNPTYSTENFIYNSARVAALNSHLVTTETGPDVKTVIGDVNTNNINGIVFAPADPDDGYLYAQVTVRIWLEGFDADAYDIIYKQAFSVSLVFTKTNP